MCRGWGGAVTFSTFQLWLSGDLKGGWVFQASTWTPAKLSRKLQAWGVVDRAYYELSTLEKEALRRVCFSSGSFSYSEGMMAEDEGSQDTLRLQFRAMQEMQHKRLQKQMEKRKEKELSLQSRGDDQKEPLEMSDGLSVLQAGEQNSKTSFEQR